MLSQPKLNIEGVSIGKGAKCLSMCLANNNKSGMSKKQKAKEYYLDGKGATAKKQKAGQKGEASHNSHSTSHNHHKYEPQHDFEGQLTSKKQLLTLKQLKMVIRCCGEYCHSQPHSPNTANSYQTTSKMLGFLRQNYQLVGPTRHVQKYQQMLGHLTPLPERICPKCQELKQPCDKYHLQELERQLEAGIMRLEQELDERLEQNEEYLNILQTKGKASSQKELERLQEIYSLQMELLQELT